MNETSIAQDFPNALYAFTGAFFDELARSGVRHAVFCPGSRSTPLVMTLAKEPRIRLWKQIDERSAAFFALGAAKYLKEPVAVICTSGTAAANFLPAIAEARLSHIPLIVITADRPHELRDCGAPQTIDQIHLYGGQVKWFSEAPLPEASNTTLRYIRTLACRAAAETLTAPFGPVHINMPFREPLTPEIDPNFHPEKLDETALFGRANGAPFVAARHAEYSAADGATMAQLASLLNNSEKPLIIAGSQPFPSHQSALLRFAEANAVPVLADPLSGARGATAACVISGYEIFLRHRPTSHRLQPDLIIRVGAAPVSKIVNQWLETFPAVPHIIVDDSFGWNEPSHIESMYIRAHSEAIFAQLNADPAMANLPKTPWLQEWRHIDSVAAEAADNACNAFTDMFEGRLYRELDRILPDNAILFAGNSMPIRDTDTFFWRKNRPITILANRAANGIDGVVSTALGVAAASGKRVYLVIGDTSLYHDMNGLLAAQLNHLPLTALVINNNGGGIFSFLSQANYPETFEDLFGAPICLDFQHTAKLYGAQYTFIESWNHLRGALDEPANQTGLVLLEMKTDRAQNVVLHREIWKVAHEAIARRIKQEAEE